MVVVAPAAVAAAQERALPLEEETTIPLISSSPLTGNHTNSNNNSNGSCRNNRKKIQVQLAYQRRIRDGEFLKLQVDATVPLIEVQLVASTIPVLAHFAWAMQHCLAQTHNNNEDTNRTDPFSPRPNNNRSSSSQNATNTNATAAVSTAASVAPGNGADVPQLQQPPTTTTMVSDSTSLLDLDLEDDDDVSDSSTDDNDDDDSVSDSDSDEEDEDEFSEGNAVGEDLQDPDERKAMSGNGKSGEETADDSPMVNPMRSSSIAPQTQPAAPATTTFKTKFAATTDDRPLLVFPNGLVFHEKVSISFSVHNVRIRTSETGSSDNYFEIIAKGVMAEALWPTITNVSSHWNRTLQTIISTAYALCLFLSYWNCFIFVGKRWLLTSIYGTHLCKRTPLESTSLPISGW